MKKILFMTLILLIILPGTTHAAKPGKFIIILLDQLSLQEIKQYGGVELLVLFSDSSQALLNVRTDKGLDSESTYTAFGAGNRGEKYGAIPGMLGELLKDHSRKAVAIGNSDYGLEEHRQLVRIIMDVEGTISGSYIGEEMLSEDPTFPGHRRSCYQKMQTTFLKAYSQYDLILLEIGDFARINTGFDREVINSREKDALIQITLARFDYLLKQIKQTITLQNDRLMLVAPSPDPLQIQAGFRLSWVVMTGENKNSLLFTGTTRRPGLATITDLAPTILDYFRIATPVLMNGRPLRPIRSTTGGLEHMLAVNEKVRRTSEWRPWYIKGFILMQIVVLTLVIFSLLGRKIISRLWWQVNGFLVLSILLIPALFLILSPYYINDFQGYLLILITVMISATWLNQKYVKHKLSSIIILATVTVLLLLIDIFRGSPWMATSMLGYCPVIGARFYGIGNEYMGFLIGGTLIGWTALLDRFPKMGQNRQILTPFVFAFVMIVTGFPTLGANFGGILTAMAAFAFSYVLMFPHHKRKRIIITVTSVMLIALSIILLADTYGWTGEQTHLGRTARLIKEDGLQALLAIILRKLSMNLKLLRWTIWTRVLLTFLVVLALLFKRPKGVLYEIVQEFPNLALGFVGVILGSVVTMMVNDSGVVAAATLLFFTVLPLVYLVLNKLGEKRL